MEAKTCRDCGESRPTSEYLRYWRSDRGKHSLALQCNACRVAHKRQYRAENPNAVEHERRYDRERWVAMTPERRRRKASQTHRARYGITLEEREAMLVKQGGVCACCGSAEFGSQQGWTLDHDHACCPGKKSCGKCLRGILCQPCNKTLGFARDSQERLLMAVAYLDRTLLEAKK